MRTQRTPVNRCPRCNEKLDAASALTEDAVPKPGDISMCMYCQAFLVFKSDLTLRLSTDDDMADLPIKQREALMRARTAAVAIVGTKDWMQ